MLLVNSSVDLTIKGIPRPNIPILVDYEMKVVVPVFQFIIYQSIENGSVSSHKTIKNYSNALYDYFSFLEANSLDWEPTSNRSQVSNISLYRNWSASLDGKASLKPSTINSRLAVIKSFYEFCHDRRMIDSLPWTSVLRTSSHDNSGFMRHTRTGTKVESTDLRLKQFKEPPKILNLNQAKQLIESISNKTLLLMVKLSITTGLRRDEISSFQRDCIFKPSADQIGNRLAVDLTPSRGKQRTKGSRPRTIYIPAPLMLELHEYIRWGEGVKRHSKSIGNDSNKLFLTTDGKEYSESALNTLLAKLTATGKINFKVFPHMLRHTFATVELYAESQTKDMAHALAWVRDRLGHSSIQTTMVYIHCIEQLEDHEVHQYQKELLELAIS